MHITYLLKGLIGGQDVETVHQHSDGGCPLPNGKCQIHILADTVAILLINLLVP